MLQALAQADPHLQDTPKIFSMLRTSSDSAQRGRVPILVKPRDLSVFDNAHNARMDLEFLAALHFALGSVLLHKAAYERMNLDVLVGDRKSTSLNTVTNAHIVFRPLLEK